MRKDYKDFLYMATSYMGLGGDKDIPSDDLTVL